MSVLKFFATHGVVNNAPQNVVVQSTSPLLAQRVFTGVGAPSASTLAAGNGRYCAATSGWVIAATLQAAGSGYAVGDVLTCSGGTATSFTAITVDAVSATGAIQDFHVSSAGQYSVYPTNPVSVTGGAGTGATFNLAFQPPDSYLDITTPTAPVAWVCTTFGSNSTSVWAQISGGAAGNWNYRGIWTGSPASPYMTYDVVQFGTGTASGIYLSTINNNTNSPDTGTGWLQVSSSSGTWL
jgi:hypothetical protein